MDDEKLCPVCDDLMELVIAPVIPNSHPFANYWECHNCGRTIFVETQEDVRLFNQRQEAAGQLRLEI